MSVLKLPRWTWTTFFVLISKISFLDSLTRDIPYWYDSPNDNWIDTWEKTSKYPDFESDCCPVLTTPNSQLVDNNLNFVNQTDLGHIDQSQTPQDESNRNNVNNAFWDLHSFDWIDQNNHEEDNTEADSNFGQKFLTTRRAKRVKKRKRNRGRKQNKNRSFHQETDFTNEKNEQVSRNIEEIFNYIKASEWEYDRPKFHESNQNAMNNDYNNYEYDLDKTSFTSKYKVPNQEFHFHMGKEDKQQSEKTHGIKQKLDDMMEYIVNLGKSLPRNDLEDDQRDSRDYQYSNGYQVPPPATYVAPPATYVVPQPVYQPPAPVYHPPPPVHIMAIPPTYHPPVAHKSFDLFPLILTSLPAVLLAGSLLGYAASTGLTSGSNPITVNVNATATNTVTTSNSSSSSSGTSSTSNTSYIPILIFTNGTSITGFPIFTGIPGFPGITGLTGLTGLTLSNLFGFIFLGRSFDPWRTWKDFWILGLDQFSNWIFNEWQSVFERNRYLPSENVERRICFDQAKDVSMYGDNVLITTIRLIFEMWRGDLDPRSILHSLRQGVLNECESNFETTTELYSIFFDIQ